MLHKECAVYDAYLLRPVFLDSWRMLCVYFVAGEAFFITEVPVLCVFFKSIEFYASYMKHDPF